MRPGRALAALAVVVLAYGCGTTPQHAMPTCPRAGGGDVLILWAQAVPSAAYVPCIQEFPTGWTFGGQSIESGRAELWLDSDRAGFRAVTAVLTARCDVRGSVEVPTEPDATGLRRFEDPRSLPPAFVGDRQYVFPGGCITYRFAFQGGGSFREVVEATEILSFVSRAEGVASLREEGLLLCGRGVECPG